MKVIYYVLFRMLWISYPQSWLQWNIKLGLWQWILEERGTALCSKFADESVALNETCPVTKIIHDGTMVIELQHEGSDSLTEFILTPRHTRVVKKVCCIVK